MKSLAVVFWAGIVGIVVMLTYWSIFGFDWKLIMDVNSPWLIPFLVYGLMFGIVFPFAFLETYLRRIRSR